MGGVEKDDAYKRLADAEIERHRNELLYEDRQALKRGEHCAVIARIRQRRQQSLAILAITCALLATKGVVMLALGSAALALACLLYARVRRTDETVERLAPELHGGGA